MKAKKFLILDRAQFPASIRHFKEVVGICVGECVCAVPLGQDDEYTTMAHAHCYNTKDYPLKGWICVRNQSVLRSKQILLHEVAHLKANQNKFTPNHGAAFKKAIREIGGKFHTPYC